MTKAAIHDSCIICACVRGLHPRLEESAEKWIFQGINTNAFMLLKSSLKTWINNRCQLEGKQAVLGSCNLNICNSSGIAELWAGDLNKGSTRKLLSLWDWIRFNFIVAALSRGTETTKPSCTVRSYTHSDDQGKKYGAKLKTGSNCKTFKILLKTILHHTYEEEVWRRHRDFKITLHHTLQDIVRDYRVSVIDAPTDVILW